MITIWSDTGPYINALSLHPGGLGGGRRVHPLNPPTALWAESNRSPSLPALQEEVLRSEVSRLRSRLSQQECLLSGAVKRLRTTNQLKEGMERVIMDQRRSTPSSQ